MAAAPIAAAQPAPPGSAAASTLQPLREVDGLLSEARRALGELDERAALRALALAERRLSGALALPLSAAFYAEVQLQIAMAAAQVGNTALAETCLRRAARVSSRRRLLAGEASPELVALASRVWADTASAPDGEVPVQVDVPGAHVWLDDADLGAAPVLLRAKVGQHVLRIEAEGHLPYGVLIEVEQGRRPAQRYALAQAAGPVAPERLAAASERAAALANDAAGLSGAGRSPSAASSARAAATTPFWRRWYVLSAVGLLAVSAGALIAVSAAPEPERQLRVVVDPTRLR